MNNALNLDKLDETEHARLIAQHFCTEHIELAAEPTSADLLPILAHQFDEPIADSSIIPTFLVSRLVRQHCTVALGGDGGDELFAGYGHYSRFLWMYENLGFIPRCMRQFISKMSEHILPPGIKGKNFLQSLSVDLRNGIPLFTNHFDRSIRRSLMRDYSQYKSVAEQIYAQRVPLQQDLLQRATRMDFENYLVEDILVKVDRDSMINSLELRAPFLDYRIIEFAFGKVPSHLKATIHDKKILLKRLATRILPPEFDKKRKQGFSIPLADWLKTGPFRDLFWDTLTTKDCIFNISTIKTLLNGQDNGRSNGERLFSLVLFELWRKEYDIEI